MPIAVPPLRERRGDIPELIRYFLDKINREMGTTSAALAPRREALLVRHPGPATCASSRTRWCAPACWRRRPDADAADFAAGAEAAAPPRHARRVARGDRPRRCAELLPQTGDVAPTDLYALTRRRVERPLIELTLERTGGNQLHAAPILGINRNTLRKKITALGIALPRGSK